jgi:hypothetical protein
MGPAGHVSIRKSTDNGATWTEPAIIKQDTDALHLASDRNQPQGASPSLRMAPS